MMIFGMDDMPEEMKRLIDHRTMHAEVSAHEFLSWLEDQDERGLQIFKSFILSFANESFATYTIGMIEMLLHKKFGICQACGKKHDEQLADMMPAEAETKQTPEPKGLVLKGASAQEVYDNLPIGVSSQLEKYGLYVEDGLWPKVKCLGCDTEYVSLDDRMLRRPGPEGCEGCIQKAKWG